MAGNTKKILIERETFETFILRVNSKARAFGTCPQCKKEVEMLSIDQAVSASSIRTSELLRRIAANEVHGIETASGHLLICDESLPEKNSQKETENE